MGLWWSMLSVSSLLLRSTGCWRKCIPVCVLESLLVQIKVEAVQAQYGTVMKSCAAFMNDSPLSSVSAATVTSSLMAYFLLRSHSALFFFQIFRFSVFVRCFCVCVSVFCELFSHYLILILSFSLLLSFNVSCVFSFTVLVFYCSSELLSFVSVVPLLLLLWTPSLFMPLAFSLAILETLFTYLLLFIKGLCLFWHPVWCLFLLPCISLFFHSVFLKTKGAVSLLLNYTVPLWSSWSVNNTS